MNEATLARIIITNVSDLVQPLAHELFGLAANLIANNYG